MVLNFDNSEEQINFYYKDGKYIVKLIDLIQNDKKNKIFSKNFIENGENIWFKTDLESLQIYSYPKDLEEEVAKNFKNFDILEKNLKELFNILRENIDSIKHIGRIQDVKTVYNYDNDYIGYNGEKYKEVAKNLKDKTFLEKAIKKIFDYKLAEIDEDGEFFLNQKFRIDILKDEKTNKFYYHKDYLNRVNELNVIKKNNKFFLMKESQDIELIENSDITYKCYIDKPLKLPMFESSINNIIPILTQFAKNREDDKYNVTIVEEPEIGLHPKSQAKFIEVLFSENNYHKTQTTILETHSEHIVNKLRYLVFKGEISPNDIVIYYKNRENDEFELMEINEKGMFKTKRENNEFPAGFFDATLDEMFEIETNAL